MLPITESINLIRYFIVLRPRHKLIKLPANFTVDVSDALAATITAQLPTREAHTWQQTRELWDSRYRPAGRRAASRSAEDRLVSIPASPWPIDAVILPYLSKRFYGEGEPLAFELKLFGEAADHGFFLEYVLAMLETLSIKPPEDSPPQSRWLWGNYRVSEIYAARGARWIPFVEDGKLSFDAYPTPLQWREGLDWHPPAESSRQYRVLVWMTPFDLGQKPGACSRGRNKKIARRDVPTVEGIIHALMTRVAQIMLDKRVTADDVFAMLPEEEHAQLWEALNKLQQRPHIQSARMTPPPEGCFGRWIGAQRFTTSIPEVAIPYLQLASILHVGHHTHFGCGTFILR